MCQSIQVSTYQGKTWNLEPETWNLRRGSAERECADVKEFSTTCIAFTNILIHSHVINPRVSARI